jgi:hypothetical protein
VGPVGNGTKLTCRGHFDGAEFHPFPMAENPAMDVRESLLNDPLSGVRHLLRMENEN